MVNWKLGDGVVGWIDDGWAGGLYYMCIEEEDRGILGICKQASMQPTGSRGDFSLYLLD